MNQEEISAQVGALDFAPLRGVGPALLPVALKELNARPRSFEKGEFLFHVGDPVPGMGLVLRGQVHILQEDFWGRRTLVGRAGAGDIFAEAYALAGQPAGVSVQAAAPCRVVWLDTRPLLAPGPGSPPYMARISCSLLGALAQKNLALAAKIRHVTQRTLRQKLLSYLSEQARRAEGPRFDIPYDRQQLADYLAVDRSALSAQLSLLQKEGVLRCRKNHFELLAPG